MVGNMKRKPKPSIKSADRSLALFGIAVFMGVGLIALPIIVGVLLVVAYVPVGVAIFLPIAYMTRRRWQPKLTKYADRYLATPDLDRMQSRVGRTRGAPKPGQRAEDPNRTASPDRRDLREIGRS